MIKSVIKPALSLFIIAALVTAFVSISNTLTTEPKASQIKKTQEKTMRQVLPNASSFNKIDFEAAGCIVNVYEGIKDKTIGFVIEAAPSGYSGTINMMVGINNEDRKISGVRIMKHSETPGLGANAVKENFYRRFDKKELTPLKVVKTGAGHDEIDAITSSTITTLAITNAVNEAIDWYNKNVSGPEEGEI